ncbi:MAG: hypothetical protein MHM6MM_001468 [Cercozoa sp. M6MM]
MSAKDDLVAQFCNVTGCDSAKSLQFLEMANWSLEGAIELFFSLGGDASAAPQTQQQSETHVPAPRQAQHTQLVEDAFLPRGRPIESYGQQWADPKSNGERNLMAMFAPPDFAFSGTLDEACTLAQNQEKWLLVNLQDGTDFDCHAVNRDLWKDEAIADMMLTQLLLWQCDSESHEAQVFFANYRLPRKFPTLVVLDPITRALMAQLPIDVRNGRIKSKATRSALRKFLREHPDPPSLRPKRPRSTAVAADTTDSTGSSDRHTDHVDEDDEDNTGSIVNLVDDEPAEKKRYTHSLLIPTFVRVFLYRWEAAGYCRRSRRKASPTPAPYASAWIVPCYSDASISPTLCKHSTPTCGTSCSKQSTPSRTPTLSSECPCRLVRSHKATQTFATHGWPMLFLLFRSSNSSLAFLTELQHIVTVRVGNQ